MAASPRLIWTPGKMSEKTGVSGFALTSWIVSRTLLENVVESISLYDPVMTFSVGFLPKIQEVNREMVRLLPCRGGAFKTSTSSSESAKSWSCSQMSFK